MTLFWRPYIYLKKQECLQYRQYFISNQTKLALILSIVHSLIFFGIVVLFYNIALEGMFSKEHRFPGHYGLTIFQKEGAEKDCRPIFKYAALATKVVSHLAYGINLFMLLAYMGSESWFISRVLAKNCTDGTTN
jgi:hypothetical protein